MRDIIQEMREHMPECFLGHHIFLPAYMAETTLDYCTAIETILLFSLGNMGQCEFLLKNKYKKIQGTFSFTLLYKSGIFDV